MPQTRLNGGLIFKFPLEGFVCWFETTLYHLYRPLSLTFLLSPTATCHLILCVRLFYVNVCLFCIYVYWFYILFICIKKPLVEFMFFYIG